jgi:hypothetical protein
MRTEVLLLSILSVGALAQVETRWLVQAERDIPRVAPWTYRGLPRRIAGYLDRHGYTIPQSYETERQHNAVRGQFDADRTLDWAVLASRGGYSQILVFWGGSVARITELNRRSDANYTGDVGGGQIGYSRLISVVGRQYILERYRRYGGPKPPPIRHEAIDDGYTGKASAVYYFDGRRWHALQGAD